MACGMESGVRYVHSTFLRHGHGQAGIVGVSLKQDTLTTWALSRHICSQPIQNLAELTDESNISKVQNCHKEEAKSQIENDKKDREMLKNQLELCVHAMKPEIHPETLVNVANGSLATPQVNVTRLSLLVIASWLSLRNLYLLDIGNP